MIEPLTETELRDVWLKLRQNGDRKYTQDEMTEILGTELMSRLLATTALIRMPMKSSTIN